MKYPAICAVVPRARSARQETEVDEQDAQNAARLRARKARGPRLIPADRWSRKSRPKKSAKPGV